MVCRGLGSQTRFPSKELCLPARSILLTGLFSQWTYPFKLLLNPVSTNFGVGPKLRQWPD